MSTHAGIIVKTPENKYRVSYVHWDGYPKHAGLYLEQFFRTSGKIKKLIDLGGLSSIGAAIVSKEFALEEGMIVESLSGFYCENREVCIPVSWSGREKDEFESEYDNIVEAYDEVNFEYVYYHDGKRWTCNMPHMPKYSFIPIQEAIDWKKED